MQRVALAKRCFAEPGSHGTYAFATAPALRPTAPQGLRAAPRPGKVPFAGVIVNAVRQQTKPDPASAEEAGGRQHAVAGFHRAGAAPGAACQGARADLLARHDGRAV